jgi:hypothetical protein
MEAARIRQKLHQYIDKGDEKLLKLMYAVVGFEYIDDEHAPDGDMIRYDDSARTIRFPVVMEDDIVTKRRITYKFTGSYFEKIK